jgi:hypothetical protein
MRNLIIFGKKTMKTALLFVLGLFGNYVLCQSSYHSTEMMELEAASKFPLLNAHSEVILVGETSWERMYGEFEFTLNPSVADVGGYMNIVRETASKQGDVSNSIFGYYDIDLSTIQINSLTQVGINVPNYYNKRYIKVYLPRCYFLNLLTDGVFINEDLSYGKNEFVQSSEVSLIDVVFYSEGFEISTVPGNNFISTTDGAANCGWSDENCRSYTGSWSAWCSGNGTGCNSCSSSGWYVSDVTSTFRPNAWISLTGYSNIQLSYMIWSDLSDAETTDNVVRYYAFNGAATFSISGDSFTSSSSIDEAGWTLRTAMLQGGNSTYKYGFNFSSGSFWNAEGVFIDDIKLTGTQLTEINEFQSFSSLIFPNPVSDILNIKSQINPNRMEVVDVNGRVVYSGGNESRISVAGLSPGLYTSKMFIKDQTIQERFIKQ